MNKRLGRYILPVGWIGVGIAAVQGCLLTLATAATITSTVADQTEVALTVYNADIGLVKEVREIELSDGEHELHFRDVAAQIIPATVHIKSLTDGHSLHLLEQNYEYDLLSPEKLLEKYVGQEVKLLDKNYYTGKEEIVTATLLSTTGSPVYKVGDEISLGLPGRVILPRIPENLVTRPTLVWRLRSRGPGKQRVEASYLTKQITWRADYVAVLSTDERRADLSGWVTIDNKSGGAYRNATLKLVAGEIHRVEEPQAMYQRAMAAAEAAPPQFREEGLFEYHVYTLDRPTTVKDNQTKQVSFLSAANIPVTKRLLLRGQQGYFFTAYGPDDDIPTQKVSVFLALTNTADNNLGLPLPKGTVRVYKADKEGALQFIGEDQIAHTPKNETVQVKMGEAFDVVGKRKQTEYKRVARNVTEVAWEITLRNRKEESVTVRVDESVPGDWEVVTASHPYEKADAHTLRFEVTVPQQGEVTVTYRVRLRV
ncbi:MAG: DUF4139 domain-containing protein [Candidatus Binatia bacterium]|nr:DUF4139 domain-containing protein [Candidatus Binatia bacterium]